MKKVLRCTVLSALFVTSMVASVLAAPFQLPVAISTPSVDQINITGYGDSIHSADVRFTINEDGSVGDIEVVKSSGVTALDEAVKKAILQWKFTPAIGVDQKAHESIIGMTITLPKQAVTAK